MSTVVGIQGDGWCVLGADSQVSEGGRAYSTTKGLGKIMKRGPYYVATVGDFRPTNIIAFNFNFPKLPPYSSVYKLDKFIGSRFIPALQQCYADNAYIPKDGDSGTDVLVAVYGNLYAISYDYSWTKDRRGYYALGSGGDYALGAMATYSPPKSIATASLIARTALSIACQYDTESGEPLLIYSQLE